jgi:hypothetical protein
VSSPCRPLASATRSAPGRARCSRSVGHCRTWIPTGSVCCRSLSSRTAASRSVPSRYVALSYEAVDLEWNTVEIGDGSWVEGRDFHMMLVPWPPVVDSSAFRPVDGPLDMDPDAFGFFSYAPTRPLAPAFLASLIDAALDEAPRLDAVVLPEAAIDRDEIGPLEDLLAARGVPALVAGTRQAAAGGHMARNYVHLGFLGAHGWVHYEQDKHHRWCLDPAQIRQYHLTRALAPTRQWWRPSNFPHGSSGSSTPAGAPPWRR